MEQPVHLFARGPSEISVGEELGMAVQSLMKKLAKDERDGIKESPIRRLLSSTKDFP